jgi:hypothetical protein
MDRDSQLKQEFEILESWTKTLANQVKSTPPLVWQILASQNPLPENCPSRGSLAVMQFGDVIGALQEVTGACDRIRSHILDSYE